MLVSFGSLPLTFVANYILIYGKLGFPALGITGIGYASAAIMWFMFLCLYVYCKKNRLLKAYISFDGFKIDSQKIYDILYIGVPSGVLLIFESGMFLFATVLMGYFGMVALAAYQIAMQTASIAYAIPFALGMTTGLQVGHAAGAHDMARVQRIVILILGVGLIVTTALALIFIFAPDRIIKIYLQPGAENYAETYHMAAAFLLIAGLFQCLDGIQSIANGALRGLKDTLIPMLISIGCYWIIGMGSAYYLSFHTRLRADGIWYGLTLGICSAGVFLLLRFVKKLKSEKNKSFIQTGCVS